MASAFGTPDAHAARRSAAGALSVPAVVDATIFAAGILGKLARGRVCRTAEGALVDFVGAAVGSSTGSVVASAVGPPVAHAARRSTAGALSVPAVVDATVFAAGVCAARSGQTPWGVHEEIMFSFILTGRCLRRTS